MVPMVLPTGWLQNNLKGLEGWSMFSNKMTNGKNVGKKTAGRDNTGASEVTHQAHRQDFLYSLCSLQHKQFKPQYNTIQYNICLCIGSFGVVSNWLCCVEAGYRVKAGSDLYAQLLLNDALRHCCWLYRPPSGSFSGTLRLSC